LNGGAIVKELTPKERVELVMNHKEPDRVPIDLGSTGSWMVDEVYFKVKDLLGIEGEIEPYRKGSTANYYDERVLEALGVDFRHVWLSSPDTKNTVMHADGSVTDDWGITWAAQGAHAVDLPLANAEPDEAEAYQGPDPYDPGRVKGLAETARRHAEQGYPVAAKSPLGGGGVFEYACYLRGLEQFMIDMMTDKKLSHRILKKVQEIRVGFYDALLSAAGEHIDIVQFMGDYGTQGGLLISPEVYREMLKPYDAELVSFIKHKAPHAKVWFHSCGAISELIPDFIETGIDILNNLQPLAKGMDSARLKAEYGNELIFHGGIDLQAALCGTEEQVKQEVEERIFSFGPGGGYILSPANHIQSDVPPENVLTMCGHARKVGQYPLKRD